MDSRLPSSDLLVACVDDVAAVVVDVRVSAPILDHSFTTFGRASGLWLGLAKCVCVPACDTGLDAMKSLLVSAVPSWHDFQVSYSAEYLGIYVGKNGHVNSCVFSDESGGPTIHI